LGVSAITTRGMKENEMKLVGGWIAQIADIIKNYQLPETKEERIEYLKNFRKEIEKNEIIKKVKKEIFEFGKKFPIPAIS